MESEKARLRIGKDAAELEVSGKSGARIGNTIADAISPFSEGLGLAGDVIHRYRIHREEIAAATMREAQRIRREENIPTKPVSPKILGPWLEHASMEDSGPENISDVWAGVLARAPEKFDSNVAAVIDVCSRIGASEVNLLNMIVNQSPKLLGPEIVNFSNRNIFVSNVFDSIEPERHLEVDLESYLEKYISDINLKMILGNCFEIEYALDGDIENFDNPQVFSENCHINQRNILFREGIILVNELKRDIGHAILRSAVGELTFFGAKFCRLVFPGDWMPPWDTASDDFLSGEE